MDFKKLTNSLEKVSLFQEGKLDLKIIEVTPPRVDVKKIRKNIGLSQKAFAEQYGFAQGTVKNWEQGLREPEGPARVLLSLIESNPKLIEKEMKKIRFPSVA